MIVLCVLLCACVPKVVQEMWLPSLPLFARRLRWIRYSTVTTQSGSDPLPRWATKLTKPNITILSSSHFNTFRLGQERYEGILHTPGFKLSSFHSNDTFELGEVSFELLLFQRYGGRAWDCGKLRQELASGSRRKWANHCRRRPTGMSLHVSALGDSMEAISQRRHINIKDPARLHPSPIYSSSPLTRAHSSPCRRRLSLSALVSLITPDVLPTPLNWSWSSTETPMDMKTHMNVGVFGMSTALWMLEERPGKYNVTILEKCETVPAPDAASTGEWCLSFMSFSVAVG